MAMIQSGEGITQSVLEKIIKNYIERNQLINDKPRSGEFTILSEIENAIKLKVNELKPMLQDQDHNAKTKIATENNFKRKSMEKYHKTIIDFEPKTSNKDDTKSASKEIKNMKDTLQETIEYHKQLQQIITTLQDIKTPSSTKKMITRTLDQVLDTLIERHCRWQSVDTVMQQVIENQKAWEPLIGLEVLLRTRDSKSPEYVTNLQGFYKNLLVSAWEILDKHKSRCYLSGKQDPGGEAGHTNVTPVYARTDILSSDKTFDKDEQDNNQCNTFIICSNELRDFLKITHSHLNDTVVSTFTDYADTYNNTESVKDIVNSVIENLRKSAETKVNEVFLNELGHFYLDKNKNKAANIKHIKNFITATTGQIKGNLSQFVDDKLTSPQIELFTKIKDDLVLNLRIDNDNLSQQITHKICDFFVLCNGVNPYGRRPFNIPEAMSADGIGDHVKLRVSLDDSMKNYVLRVGEERLNSWQGGKNDRVGKIVVDAVGQKIYNAVPRAISSTVMTGGVVSSENGIVDQFF